MVYDAAYQLTRAPFAEVSRDQLKDIIIHLQSQVITNLKVAWQQDTFVDFNSLQDASDEGQNKAILCLLQLHQRILMQAPIIELGLGSSPPSSAPMGFIEPQSRQTSWLPQRPVEPSRAIEAKVRNVSGRLPESQFRQSSWLNQSASPPSRQITRDFEAKDRARRLESQSRQLSWASQPPTPSPQGTPAGHELEEKTSSRFVSRIKVFRRPKGHSDAQRNPVEEINLTQPTLPSPPIMDEARDLPSSNGVGLGKNPQTKTDSDSVSVSTVNVGPDCLYDNPWNEPEEPVVGGSHQSPQSSKLSPDRPLAPVAPLLHRNSQSSGLSRKSQTRPGLALSHRSSQSSIRSDGHQFSPDITPSHRSSQASAHSWQSPTIPINSSPHRLSQASILRPRKSSSILESTTSNSSDINPRGYLPSEDNGFAGMCKSAWRMQIGEKKKAIEERAKPASAFVMVTKYWKCTQCQFEGPMTKDANGKKSVDMRVYSTNGIRYRWGFLFKSHVQMRESVSNPLAASTFGCIFCCAEGKGTPTFGGVHSFLAHLQEHRVKPPTGEVLYRANCIVGQVADPEQDFDINLPAL